LSLFAKNLPTKRIEIGEGNWVEIRKLSKGFKDQLKGEATDVFKGMDLKGELGTVPEGMILKVQEVEYRKLRASIVRWSADVDITIENIKELDEEVYNRILKEVDEMNGLSQEEQKN
jgi:hypothetical protein